MTLRWDQLRFRYPFRKYQTMVLNQIAAIVGTPHDDRRYHIVAPPGSGKTIIGLELIRRFQRPALILAPTVAIQMQWYEKVRMFLPDDVPLEEWATTTPERAAPLQIFTYQRLAVQDPDRSFSESASRTEWAEEVIARGLAADPEEAQRYLDTLKAQNPTAYWREIRRRYPRLKRRLLREDPTQIARFLHPNALELIEQLVTQRIGVVVLDECHHLLDYWAVVLRYLIGRLDQPRVIGLTATLPSPEDEWGYENYTALLGDVDFEVPTPAVVKEGNLAPYRELAYFTEPTPEELAFLRERDRMLHAILDPVLTSPRFVGWLRETLLSRSTEEAASDPGSSELEAAPPVWNEQVEEDPLLVLAGLRWLRAHGQLAESDPMPPEARRNPTLEDQLILLERYALQVLLPSPDPADHQRFTELGRRLRPFGYTLTPRGLRQGRSPMDLILAFSDSKIHAAREILVAEKRALGERLRAIVVTDFEQSAAGLRRLHRESGGLDADLGSGRRVFRQLSRDPEIAELHPVFVTGESLWIAEDFYPAFQAFWEEFRKQQERGISLSFQRHAGYYEVKGKGPDWGPRVYVPLITRAMEQGLTRLLIGTRGIFGEGWDALSLNVVIDLTGVTTSVAVQQLRGRSLRLDPEWPHKVAHNWDVVCVAPGFEWGDHDLQRFRRRHEHLWGIAMPAAPTDYVLRLRMDPYEAAALQELKGQIIRGLFHVEPGLALRLASDPESWKRVPYERINPMMLKAAARREETYRAWEVGKPYSNFEGRVARIRLRDPRVRTVHTLRESAATLWRSLRWALLGILSWSGLIFGELASRTPKGAGPGWWVYMLAVSLTMGAGITLFRNRKTIARALRVLLLELPPDAILLDIGRALLAALREAGLIRSGLSEDHLQVVLLPDGACSVRLHNALPEEAALFIQAYRELFAPIRNPRYLIIRLDDRLPEWLAGGLWKRLRAWIPPALRRPVYYPVPQVLAANRPYAEAFVRAWERYVGAGQLIYTRSPEGRRHLYRARLQESFSIRDLLLTLWE